MMAHVEIVDLERLAAWMDDHGLGDGPLTGVEHLGGGTQNILLRFDRAGRTYVLRHPPPHKRDNSDETMRREARVLTALAGTTIPHPAIVAAEPSTDVLGSAFYLTELVDGFNPSTGLPPLHAGDPAIRHRMGLAMVEAIADLGALDHEALGLRDLGRPEGYLERQAPRWRAHLESYAALDGYPGPDIPGVDDVAAWLDAHVPPGFRPGIIHGDVHFANVLVRHDSGELAALVDWELTTIGDPLVDLGGVLATWPDPDRPGPPPQIQPWDGFATPAELVEAYGARSHRDLSHLDWYVVLSCYKLGIILEGTNARADAGLAPRETGDLLHMMTVSLFTRALARIG
jgi:aminoglycoside phosphotransferase (APT) family kinase protein